MTMGCLILRLEGEAGPRYLEWSTIVDAPVTFGMTRDDLAAHYRESYGTEGMREFDRLMERVDRTGTSAHNTTAESAICANRAGPDETELSAEELYTAYCLMQPIRNGWMVPVVDNSSQS